ncbi:MAG: HD domain-containing protein [Paludibacteraceae bacterium]|nr:HD domain-containing protein [Candidatus Physcocola equi]MCQ2234329.1 HD domain-containing protein [Paludibacteraceae bacterium]
MNKRKIINDPVLGFVSIPSELLYDIIQHPYVQRLNRIKQLGMSFMVYPGAQHSRFLHSIGAMHLMQEALNQLRNKGHEITDAEYEGALACILLHDVGHAPFSHVLERLFTEGVTHEDISLEIMEQINRETHGKLDTCIAIFKDTYPKHFLHQLVSSQLDMDRLDYLMRDSFFTGVVEGSVGTERIIKMLDVWNDNLCVEGKGIYSIEKFLIARRIMYWQVYYHKTSVAAERVLINMLKRAKDLTAMGHKLPAQPWLSYFLEHTAEKKDFANNGPALQHYTKFDDNDIVSVAKMWMDYPDKVLSILSRCVTNRHLFKVRIQDTPISLQQKQELENYYAKCLDISEEESKYLHSELTVSTNTYSHKNNNSPIFIKQKDGRVEEILNTSEILDITMLSKEEKKYYFCYFPM